MEISGENNSNHWAYNDNENISKDDDKDKPEPKPEPKPDLNSGGTMLATVAIVARPVLTLGAGAITAGFAASGYVGWQMGPYIARNIEGFAAGLAAILAKMGVPHSALYGPAQPSIVKTMHKKSRYKEGDVIPTPETQPGKFKRKRGGDWQNTETGEIYKKSNTSHGNPGNIGTQWKVYPEGTSDFGSNSKKSGERTTLDPNGKVIGN